MGSADKLYSFGSRHRVISKFCLMLIVAIIIMINDNVMVMVIIKKLIMSIKKQCVQVL